LNIKPTNDLLIVRRLLPEQPTTASGIFLPKTEETADTPYTGIVLACGPGKPCTLQPAAKQVIDILREIIETCKSLANGHGINHGITMNCIERAEEAMKLNDESVARLPMTVKVGDKIIYSRHGHQIFRVNGEDLVTFGESSVIGIIDY
jgi:co-chaperonin GroES (HSP10)